MVGAAWMDSLILLICPRGDGLDVERIIAERRLLRDVPADHVDRVLAVLSGYLLSRAAEPVPPTSPTCATPSVGRATPCGTGCANGGVGDERPRPPALVGLNLGGRARRW